MQLSGYKISYQEATDRIQNYPSLTCNCPDTEYPIHLNRLLPGYRVSYIYLNKLLAGYRTRKKKSPGPKVVVSVRRKSQLANPNELTFNEGPK